MSGLDVYTPKGQIALEDQKRAMAVYANYSHNFTIGTEEPARPDTVVITRDLRLLYLGEVKSRYDCSYDKFMGQYRGQWLVTAMKVKKIALAARIMNCDVIGICYIVPSQVVLVKKIWDRKRGFTKHTIEQTVTKATTNGGKALRWNMYIDMTDALRLEADDYLAP